MFLCECTTVIRWLPCLFTMAKAVSSTNELVNSVTSNSVNSCKFAMWSFASKCFPYELFPWFDGWRRTWWQTIHMIPGLPVSSIPQCKYNRHQDACLESFQAIGCIGPTFIEAHRASDMICKARSLKPQIMTCSFLEEIITSRNEVIRDFEHDMAVGIRKLYKPTQDTAKSYVIVKQNAGSSILTQEVQAKNLICETLHV